MRANKWYAWFLALTATLLASAGLSAHRQDEYLQAARLAVDPSRVELALDLTPGIAVADAIITEIDRDRDGFLAADEQREYVQRLLGAIELQVDGQPLRTAPTASTFPVLDAFRHGDGTIRLQMVAVLPRLSEGHHQLLFRNTHRPEVSAYLANALVPESDAIAITGQSRDGDQQALTIDFVLQTEPAAYTRVWLLIGIASAALLVALAATPRRNWPLSAKARPF